MAQRHRRAHETCYSCSIQGSQVETGALEMRPGLKSPSSLRCHPSTMTSQRTQKSSTRQVVDRQVYSPVSGSRLNTSFHAQLPRCTPKRDTTLCSGRCTTCHSDGCIAATRHEEQGLASVTPQCAMMERRRTEKGQGRTAVFERNAEQSINSRFDEKDDRQDRIEGVCCLLQI